MSDAAAGRVGERQVRPLVSGKEAFVLNFLNQEPLKNVVMIGFIRDHGLEGPSNRGACYGCFQGSHLTGVALIGHRLVLCGDSEAVVRFADIAAAGHAAELRLVLGDEVAVGAFCARLSAVNGHLAVHRSESQALCAMTEAKGESEEPEGLRLARLSEVDELAIVHAKGYLEASGVDPTAQDPEGFRRRVLERIQQGRVWIVRDEQGIAFKTDILTETDQAVYLQGVWTRPDLRRRRCGSTLLKDLCRRLLHDGDRICLFTEAKNERTLSFYRKVGFEPVAPYSFIRYLPSHQ